MQAAFYKAQDHLFNRLASWKTAGPYSHCEGIFGINPTSGLAVCASSSFLDGGIRFKELALSPQKWDIIDVPVISAADAAEWFVAHEFYLDEYGVLRRTPYDVRGVINFIVPVGHSRLGYFCDEALGAACALPEPQRFDPNSLACVLERLGGSWIQGGPAWAAIPLAPVPIG